MFAQIDFYVHPQNWFLFLFTFPFHFSVGININNFFNFDFALTRLSHRFSESTRKSLWARNQLRPKFCALVKSGRKR